MTDSNVANVALHAQTRNLKEIVITPDHVKRSESAEFRQAKKRLKADGHYSCWVCGTTEALQLHHYGAEWSLANVIDYERLKEYCETFDVYGYGRLLRNQPITSVDDIRNLMWLCTAHHVGVDHADGGYGTGVHEITYPVWVAQRLARDGVDVVPQAGETIDDAEKTVREDESHA